MFPFADTVWWDIGRFRTPCRGCEYRVFRRGGIWIPSKNDSWLEVSSTKSKFYGSQNVTHSACIGSAEFESIESNRVGTLQPRKEFRIRRRCSDSKATRTQMMMLTISNQSLHLLSKIIKLSIQQPRKRVMIPYQATWTRHDERNSRAIWSQRSHDMHMFCIDFVLHVLF